MAIANFLPTGGSLTIPYEFAGAPPVDEQQRPTLSVLVVSPDYFRAVDAPILSGRSFTDSDGASGQPVVIVNQRFVAKYWPGQDPLGKRLRLFDGPPGPGGGAQATKDWLTVIGVVPNIVQNDITAGNRRFDLPSLPPETHRRHGNPRQNQGSAGNPRRRVPP